MPQDLIANLEALLEKGGDSATLRLALASRYLEAGDAMAAVRHAQGAVRIDAEYSAGWKALGKALAAAGKTAEAQQAYERGIEVASGAVTDRRLTRCESSQNAFSAPLHRNRRPKKTNGGGGQ